MLQKKNAEMGKRIEELMEVMCNKKIIHIIFITDLTLFSEDTVILRMP